MLGASVSLVSCGSETSTGDTTTDQKGLPSAEQMQRDLLGKTITDPTLGEWEFESLSEFIDFSIESQKVTDSRAEFVIDMLLEDIHDGLQYNGEATVVYTKVNGQWRLSDVSGEYRSAQPSV